MPGPSELSGLVDKLYWRRAAGAYHCFRRRRREHRFDSLCGRHTIDRVGDQAIDRPESWGRCGRCDGLEMERRGHEESLPARHRR